MSKFKHEVLDKLDMLLSVVERIGNCEKHKRKCVFCGFMYYDEEDYTCSPHHSKCPLYTQTHHCRGGVEEHDSFYFLICDTCNKHRFVWKEGRCDK